MLYALAPDTAFAVAPAGSEFQVNTHTTERQRFPRVASDSAGNFVVVWHSYGHSGNDTSGYSIQGQRFDANGAPVGAEFQVNTYTTNSQSNPQVACDAGGGFVVVWMSDGSASGDTDGSIHGQRYDASGAPVGSEFQVNTYTTNSQELPSVASDSAGDFVVVWDGFGSPGSDTSPPAPLTTSSVHGRAFEANGSPIGDQFQVNTYTTGNQMFASVAANSSGTQFAVVWQSYGSTGTDTDESSVQGQRYLPEPSLPGSLAAAFAMIVALARRRA